MEDQGVEEVIYEDGQEWDDAMSAGSWETVDGQEGRSAWDGDGDVEMDGEQSDAAEANDVDVGVDDDHDDADIRDMDEVNRIVDAEPHSPVQSTALIAPASPRANGGDLPSGSVARAMDAGPSSSSVPYVTPEDIGWERFEMLEEAPAEHHFYPQPQQAGTKAWMTRMQKEHRALRSSLPGMSHSWPGVQVGRGHCSRHRQHSREDVRGPARPDARPHCRARGHAVQ
jgi:ubiquitin-conjugating enzyme E2 O